MLGLKTETVLGYFTGGTTNQIVIAQQYREYVEGANGKGLRALAPEVTKQVFVGEKSLRRRRNGKSRN